MIEKILKKKNNTRTKKVNFQTLISLFFRAGSILLSLILVPLTINYLTPDIYGVWITITSIIGWTAMLDIGIGNGLKNKLTESITEKNYEKGRMYVSTTYLIIFIIALILICIYFISNETINWQEIFNTREISQNKLRNVLSIVFVLFMLKFVTDIINVVSASFHMVAVSSFLLFISNLGITISVWILSKTSNSNIILMAFFLSFIPFLVSLVANVFLFKKHFSIVKPSIRYINFKESKSIVTLGYKFFILQIIGLILFQTDNILITQFFSPKEVTNFNVAYKYYSIIIVIYSILMTPYWTAFTEAYLKKDYIWIKNTINKLIKYWLLSVLILIMMFLCLNYVIDIWIGKSIIISFKLSLSICFYIIIFNWNTIFANFLNGVGKIRVQVIYAILMGIINIPLSILFIKKFNWGIYSMPISNFTCLLIGAIVSYIQYKKIINNRAVGIWNL